MSADIKAIEDILLRISRLVEEIPEISELDLNPIFALQKDKAARSWMPESSLGFRKCAFTPQECEIGQSVCELLSRHPGIWKHPRAGVSFPDCMRALLVSF
jgi:hypothetical protein